MVEADLKRIRKAKVHLEQNPVRNVMDNKKGCYIYITSKNKTTENEGLLLNGARTWNKWTKATVLNVSTPWFLLVRSAFRNPRFLRLVEKSKAR